MAGAALSSVATILQLGAVLWATSRPTLYQMKYPLLASGFAAIVYGVLFTLGSTRQQLPLTSQKGRAFSLRSAILLAALIAAVLVLSAALNKWPGKAGVSLAAAVAGFADTHSAAVSVALLVASGKLTVQQAVLPILAGLTTNTVSKAVLAISSGGMRYALQIVPGLVFMIAVAWIASFAT